MVTATNADRVINMKSIDKNKLSADEIRKEFSAQSDTDLIFWKASISNPDFKTITEHVKEEAEKFVQTIPF